MRSFIIVLAYTLSSILPLSNIHGQTLFSFPDTVPDYSSYRHLDECIAGLNRLEKSPEATGDLWIDTADIDTTRYRSKASSSLVESMLACISKTNPDSISLRESPAYIRALLVANMDDRITPVIDRLKDSMIADTRFGIASQIIRSLISAKPARLQLADRLYQDIDRAYHADSLYDKIIHRFNYSFYFNESGLLDLKQRYLLECLQIADTLSDKYRTERLIGAFKFFVYPTLASNTSQEAFDSLAVSTNAYRDYLSNIWTRLMRSEPTEADIDPFAMQAPNLVGHFWYSNTDGKIQTTSQSIQPIPNVVNILYFVQAGCHSNGWAVVRGRNNGRAMKCWGEINKIRKIMQQYPNIKLTVVTNIFGSFGSAPPLTPEQEADTLANYFLGFHKLKGTHIVYKTEYIKLAGYDRRIVDMQTENQSAYKNIVRRNSDRQFVLLIDELGKVFHDGMLSGTSGPTVDMRLKAVMGRPANRMKE